MNIHNTGGSEGERGRDRKKHFKKQWQNMPTVEYLGRDGVGDPGHLLHIIQLMEPTEKGQGDQHPGLPRPEELLR